eukprot:6555_1
MENIQNNPPFAPNPLIEYELQQLIANQAILENVQKNLPFPPGEQEPSKLHWNKLCSKLGILAIFGFMYWTIITFFAFLIQFDDKSKSWLFKYCVVSMTFAFCCHASIISMVVAGYDEKNTYFRSVNLPITTLAIFPYALFTTFDLIVHMGSTFLGKTLINNNFSVAFIVCDSISLFCISFVYFAWHQGDTKFRIMNFCFEWVDICSQIAVTLLYSRYSESDNKVMITKIFWVLTLVQLFFWIVPLTLGSSQKINNLVKHIIVLDIITDIPLIITTLMTEAYTVQFWILVDLFFKMMLMLRGVVINGCIYVLLPYLTK